MIPKTEILKKMKTRKRLRIHFFSFKLLTQNTFNIRILIALAYLKKKRFV